MNWEKLVNGLADQPWAAPLAGALGSVVTAIFREPGGAIENFFHGLWLGHPLHPALTDVPIGAWTVAAVLDSADMARGSRDFSTGADAAVAVGLGGALAAALAGMADWGRIDGRARRLGAIHATMNITASTLYGLSFLARKGGKRGFGRALAFTGLAVAGSSAYLGGHLSFDKQIGMNRTTSEKKPKEFNRALSDSDLVEGDMRRVEVGGAAVLLARQGGQVFAMADTCSHLGCSLAKGRLEGDSIRCNCHGSRYALQDGRVLDGPSTYWQPAYEVRILDGEIQVGKRFNA